MVSDECLVAQHQWPPTSPRIFPGSAQLSLHLSVSPSSHRPVNHHFLCNSPLRHSPVQTCDMS